MNNSIILKLILVQSSFTLSCRVYKMVKVKERNADWKEKQKIHGKAQKELEMTANQI